MSYTTRYTGTKQARRAAALKDAFEYLNNMEMWINLVGAIRQTRAENGIRNAIKQARMWCMMLGIQGAPAYAVMMFALRHKGHWMNSTMLPDAP
jgi:hypothetical protein